MGLLFWQAFDIWMVSVLVMTRLSDRFGRRPVILIGTAGLAISTMLFGLATNFKSMVIFRVLGKSWLPC